MHTIRLRSAWTPAVADSADGAPRRFERAFGQPTNLGVGRVFLAVEPKPQGRVFLNGEPVEAASPAAMDVWRADITPRLISRNLLAIEADSPTFAHEVRLEIVE